MKKKLLKILSQPLVKQIFISALCAAQALVALTLSLSTVRFLEAGLRFSVPLYMLAMAILFLLLFALGGVFARPLMLPFIGNVILNIIAIINYYELRFHGTVLTHQDIRNIGTAYRQLGNYTFELTLPVRCIIISFLLLQLMLALFYKFGLETKVNRKLGFISCAVLIVLSYVLVFSPLAIVRDGRLSWEKEYFTDSFVVGTLENIKRAMRPMVKLEGYSEEALQDYVTVQASVEDYPDIIMILNETYYDVEHLMNFDLDCNPMKIYQSLNAYKGYATVPFVGGVTNSSEYELLTSNSVSILGTSTPFNDLNLENSNSIVKYLEENGYVTMAAHSEPSGNYHRGASWNNLGFDKMFFQIDFNNLERFGYRWAATDHSVFANFKRFYENMPESQPRFAYLLTIQNHGNWDQNDAALDTVHVGKTNGISEESRQMLNEYLSSVKLTDDFINELTTYFAGIDRNVIVYMVGDHCPHMIGQIESEEAETTEDKDDFNLKKREVPYFIWTNYTADYSMVPENNVIDLCALTPYVIKATGLPISPYYNQLLQLSEHVSCVTKIQVGDNEGDPTMGFVNLERVRESVYSGSEDAELVKKYFYMEYNNLQKHDRMEYLFNVGSESHLNGNQLDA